MPHKLTSIIDRNREKTRGPTSHTGVKVLVEELFYYCQCVVLLVKKGSLFQHSKYQRILSALPLFYLPHKGRVQ
jgi:hypothetical protein